MTNHSCREYELYPVSLQLITWQMKCFKEVLEWKSPRNTRHLKFKSSLSDLFHKFDSRIWYFTSWIDKLVSQSHPPFVSFLRVPIAIQSGSPPSVSFSISQAVEVAWAPKNRRFIFHSRFHLEPWKGYLLNKKWNRRFLRSGEEKENNGKRPQRVSVGDYSVSSSSLLLFATRDSLPVHISDDKNSSCFATQSSTQSPRIG